MSEEPGRTKRVTFLVEVSVSGRSVRRSRAEWLTEETPRIARESFCCLDVQIHGGEKDGPFARLGDVGLSRVGDLVPAASSVDQRCS